MPDLMKTPSNRRYVVNFQHKEPINKYDIWLSFNKHEQGNQVIVDSEYLADKDLVFKIYMNGKWVPILGIPVSYEGIIQALEELDKKKMNLIKPTPLVDGHIPVIHQGSDDCDQLIDGGDIATLIEEYITKYGFIPIARATTNRLGGIKAAIHTHEDELDQYVEAKFKGPEGPMENDRLYVSAAEIIRAINIYTGGGGEGFELQLMGPSTRGGAMANAVPVSWDSNRYVPVLINQTNEHMYINGDDILSVLIYILKNDPLASIYEAGEGIDIEDNIISIKTAEDDATGGVRARVNPTQNSVPGIEVTRGNNDITDVYFNRVVDNKHLCFTRDQLLALWNYQDENVGPMLRNGYGTWVRYWHELNPHTGLYDDYITVSLNYDDTIDRDKFLKSKADGSGIEWVTLSPGQAYDPLSANSVYGTNYVVAAPQTRSGFLRWDGEFVDIPAGSTVSITPLLHTGTKIADYSINNIGGSLYAPNSVYTEGNGIDITNNVVSIDTTNAIAGYVLAYTPNLHDVVSWVPQLTYSRKEGVVIDNTNHTIGGMITWDNTTYRVDSSLTFNCTIGHVGHPITGIEAILDNDAANSIDLLKYSYSEIGIMAYSTISLTFDVSNQKTYMQGIPVYVLLNVTGKADAIKVRVVSADELGLININNAVTVDSDDNSCLNSDYAKFLVTMQFGITKIEPLESTVTVNNNPQEES